MLGKSHFSLSPLSFFSDFWNCVYKSNWKFGINSSVKLKIPCFWRSCICFHDQFIYLMKFLSSRFVFKSILPLFLLLETFPWHLRFQNCEHRVIYDGHWFISPISIISCYVLFNVWLLFTFSSFWSFVGWKNFSLFSPPIFLSSGF